LGQPLRITSGPAIERSGDLAAVLSTLSEGEVVFIDEIHRLARPAEEMLYLAMEDFRVDVGIGKGPGATAHPAVGRAARGDAHRRGRGRALHPFTRDAQDREPAAAPGARLRRGARRRCG